MQALVRMQVQKGEDLVSELLASFKYKRNKLAWVEQALNAGLVYIGQMGRAMVEFCGGRDNSLNARR